MSRRLEKTITVKGRVVTNKYISSNIGWLRVVDCSQYKDCEFFELWKGRKYYVVRRGFKLNV